MSSMNKVILIGNLGKDAQTRDVGEQKVATFSVATSRRWKGPNGEWQEQTDWHNIVMWNPGGVAPYLKKGTKVAVSGRLQTRSYEADGAKKWTTEVVAEPGGVQLLGSKQNGGQNAPPPDASQAPPKPAGAATQPPEPQSDKVPF